MPGVAYLAYVNTVSGKIESINGVGANIPEHNSMIDSSIIIKHLLKDELSSLGFLSPAQFLEETDWIDSSWVTRGPRPSIWYTYGEGRWNVDNTRILADIRLTRTHLLYQSDWTQGADSPLSNEKKAEWVTYRQALRDIMNNLPSDLDDPENVSWPTEPS